METLFVIWSAVVIIDSRSTESIANKLTYSDKQNILDRHNALRNAVAAGSRKGNFNSLPFASNMNELLWDEGLAHLAGLTASQCNRYRDQQYAHDLDPNLSHFRYNSATKFGENIAFMYGQSNSETIQDLTEMWIEEGYSYHYGQYQRTDFCNVTNNTSITECNHFTQMIWAETRYLGCAVHDCSSDPITIESNVFDTFYVCEYYPGGNVIGSYPYKSGKPCTDCDGDRDNQCDTTDGRRDSLCGGGVDSSFHIDGTVDIDHCDNGLGVMISNACDNKHIMDIPKKRHLQNQPDDLPSSCQDVCDTLSISVDSYRKYGDNVCITYSVNRLFYDGLCSPSIQDIILAACPRDIEFIEHADFSLNDLIISLQTTVQANIIIAPDIESGSTSTSSESSSGDAQSDDDDDDDDDEWGNSIAIPSPTADWNPSESTNSTSTTPTAMAAVRTISPTINPTSNPTINPTSITSGPTTNPTAITRSPTIDPTVNPTTHPTSNPSTNPTAITSAPTINPTINPTLVTNAPTSNPTTIPTINPTTMPTAITNPPSINPTAVTNAPSINPTAITNSPSTNPTNIPTINPTVITLSPTSNPTTESPTMATDSPTTATPTMSENPTASPSQATSTPTTNPSINPTEVTTSPSSNPTTQPTSMPTAVTNSPSSNPTNIPTINPTMVTNQPTINPTTNPTNMPTTNTQAPTTAMPTAATDSPTTAMPTAVTTAPTFNPTNIPSINPTKQPTFDPTIFNPTDEPTTDPTTKMPTFSPTVFNPTDEPTEDPTLNPSNMPTQMTQSPTTAMPTTQTQSPTTAMPTAVTLAPTNNPTTVTNSPSNPTNQPTSVPTSNPTTCESLCVAIGLRVCCQQPTEQTFDSQCLADCAGASECANGACGVRRRLLPDDPLGIRVSIDISYQQSFQLCMVNVFEDIPDFSNIVQYDENMVCEESFVQGLPCIDLKKLENVLGVNEAQKHRSDKDGFMMDLLSIFFEDEGHNGNVEIIGLNERGLIALYVAVGVINMMMLCCCLFVAERSKYRRRLQLNEDAVPNDGRLNEIDVGVSKNVLSENEEEIQEFIE